MFREVVEGWSHVPLALAPIGVENPQCCMQFQLITSTWLKNCQSRQVAQVLHMSFCTSNSNKICSIMQPLRGVYGIQRNHQSNAVPIAAQITTTSQYCMMKSQGWNYNDCRKQRCTGNVWTTLVHVVQMSHPYLGGPPTNCYPVWNGLALPMEGFVSYTRQTDAWIYRWFSASIPLKPIQWGLVCTSENLLGIWLSQS